MEVAETEREKLVIRILINETCEHSQVSYWVTTPVKYLIFMPGKEAMNTMNSLVKKHIKPLDFAQKHIWDMSRVLPVAVNKPSCRPNVSNFENSCSPCSLGMFIREGVRDVTPPPRKFARCMKLAKAVASWYCPFMVRNFCLRAHTLNNHSSLPLTYRLAVAPVRWPLVSQ